MGDNPEMPVVMFTNYKRADGFEVSLTLRGRSIETVATDLDNAIKGIIKANGTPVSRNSGFAKREAKPVEYIEGRECPKDGARIIAGTGKIKEKCENYKFDFTTKKNVGSCDYIVWN